MSKLKKHERDFDYIVFLPLFLFGIDRTFAEFFYIILGLAPTAEVLKSSVSYGSGIVVRGRLLNLALLYVPLLAWYFPIWKYIRTKDEKLCNTVKRRITSVYKAAFSYARIVL